MDLLLDMMIVLFLCFLALLQKRYGKFQRHCLIGHLGYYEFFLDPYKLGDGYELQAIKLEKGYYSTYWYLDLGIISIKIKALSNYTGWIMPTYEDAAGFSIKTKEKEQMISNDI